MTELDKLVNKQSKDAIICIGSKSAYMFCGTKKEYERDIDAVSAAALQKFIKLGRQNKNYAKRRYKLLLESTFRGEIPDPLKLRTLNDAIVAMLRNRAFAARFTPVRTRKIKKYYPSITRDGINVIIEGDEDGDYWDEEEYRRGWK